MIDFTNKAITTKSDLESEQLLNGLLNRPSEMMCRFESCMHRFIYHE